VPLGASPLVFGALLIAADTLWPRLLPWPVGIVIFASDNLTQTAALGGTKTLTLIVAIFGCAVGQVIV
jgi:hypothetical protein